MDPVAPQFLKGRRVLLDDAFAPAFLRLQDGKIAEIGPCDSAPAEAFDAGDLAILPAFVDTHVHVNEPGRTQWEGFETATRAAAAGGIGTVVDMPLNSLPVTTTPEALAAKLAAASGKTWVDCAFWGGLVPANARDLAPLLDAGVLGVKCFLIDSGISEFPEVSEEDLRAAMPLLAERRIPLLVHAEREIGHAAVDGDPRAYRTYLASRPPGMEVEAIRLMIRLCREFGCQVHIVHLSAADALPDLAAARAEGLPITVETCPHYLTFAAEDIPDGATAFKCAPPIRQRDHRERLWQGLRDGVVDFVVCDHSPCTPDLKKPEQGDFLAAWGGISSVQLGPAIVWTEACRRGFELADLVRWCAQGPAFFAGLDDHKGTLAEGLDADVVVWDPDATFEVRPDHLHHRHLVTPYAGMTLSGIAVRTYVGGRLVHDAGRLATEPAGRAILRSRRRTAQRA